MRNIHPTIASLIADLDGQTIVDSFEVDNFDDASDVESDAYTSDEIAWFRAPLSTTRTVR